MTETGLGAVDGNAGADDGGIDHTAGVGVHLGSNSGGMGGNDGPE